MSTGGVEGEELTFPQIVKALRTLRYTVFTTPQEKISERQLIVLMDDIDLQVETVGGTSYEMDVSISIEWMTEHPETILPDVIKMVSILETAISQPTFKLGKPLIKFVGSTYRITMYGEYREIIDVGGS